MVALMVSQGEITNRSRNIMAVGFLRSSLVVC